MIEPTNEDLAQYLEENSDKFRSDPTFTFEQLFFNPEELGPEPIEAVTAKLKEIQAGGEVEGSRTLLPQKMENASARSVDGTFGRGFANDLVELETGKWSGPVGSGYGLHLVKIEEVVPGRVPNLEEIEGTVRREWEHNRNEVFKSKFNEEILKEFEIEIEWPDSIEKP